MSPVIDHSDPRIPIPARTFRAQCEKKPGDDDVLMPDIAVTGELVLFIGRQDPRVGGQHLDLEHPRVSERQAMIFKAFDYFIVLDYELEYGTFVNGRLVAGYIRLWNRDILSFAVLHDKSYKDALRKFCVQNPDVISRYQDVEIAYKFLVHVTDEGIRLEHFRGSHAQCA